MKTCITVWFVAIVLAGCSRRPEEASEIAPAPRPQGTYKHPVHGFVIPVPDGWDIRDTGIREPIAVTLVSPAKDAADFRENFSVQLQPNTAGLTAQQHFEEGLAERRLVKEFTLVTTGQESIGNDTAVSAIFAMKLGGGDEEIEVKVLSYTIVSGKNVYTLTAVATPESFDEFKGLFRGLALAFQPK